MPRPRTRKVPDPAPAPAPPARKGRSRADRGLGHVTRCLLSHFPLVVSPAQRWMFRLEETALSLDCRPGIIYDICNVLEAALVVSKIAPGAYKWNGLNNLPEAMEAYRRIARTMIHRVLNKE